jgi:peroxiredoxin
MTKLLTLAAAGFVLLCLAAFSPTQDTPELAPGATAPDFSLKNVDGTAVSLTTNAQAKGYILVFTCNHCPYAIKYEDRIMALDAKYRPLGYPVIAINPNDPERVPDDSFENMQTRAREKGFTFPYLFDATQATARAYGASKTPHVFIVQREGSTNKFIVRYVGAIDDSPNNAASASKHYAADAVDALLAGRNIRTATTRAIGCSIKWRQS